MLDRGNICQRKLVGYGVGVIVVLVAAVAACFGNGDIAVLRVAVVQVACVLGDRVLDRIAAHVVNGNLSCRCPRIVALHFHIERGEAEISHRGGLAHGEGYRVVAQIAALVAAVVPDLGEPDRLGNQRVLYAEADLAVTVGVGVLLCYHRGVIAALGLIICVVGVDLGFRHAVPVLDVIHVELGQLIIGVCPAVAFAACPHRYSVISRPAGVIVRPSRAVVCNGSALEGDCDAVRTQIVGV